MLILLLFAFLAGFMTVLSPCVLPVLPAILSAGTSPSRSRSFGVIFGLIVSFTFFTLTLGVIVHATGISANVLRYAAIIIIGLFGVFLLVPRLGNYFAEKTSSIADIGSSVQSRYRKKEGFFGGFLLGVALGLVWTPCAGPILASVIAIAATQSVSWKIVLVTLAYAIGSGVPMLLLMLGSSRVLQSSRFLSKHAEGIRQFFGAIMIVTAVALYYNVESKLQELSLSYFPSVNIETNAVISDELSKLRQEDHKTGLNSMPDFVKITDWINSQPLTPDELKGKVVLIDFWTYSCINCIRTFPYLNSWYHKYKDKGLVIIGVHTPEFEFEKNVQNVKDAVKRFHIDYPVAMDNDYGTWTAYHNAYWPAHYLFDRQGDLQDKHFGEGAYLETENKIRQLLGLKPIEAITEKVISRPLTPETYLGAKRGGSYPFRLNLDQDFDYPATNELFSDQVALKGKWRVEDEKIISKSDSSELSLNFASSRVYLVMSSEQPALVEVLLDGRPLPKEYYTDDMNMQGKIKVHEPRKYDVINLHMDYGRHKITLIFPKGVEAFAFTFGDEP